MSQGASSSQTPQFRIFLSHAGEDKETIARPLWKRLREYGLSVFLDEKSFDLGDHCPNVMDHAMETAPIGVFVMSPEFVAKHWPMRELLAFVRRYDRAVAAKETAPMLIPIFYRFHTYECRDPTVFKKYNELFDRHGLFKRALDDVISFKDVKHALHTAATLWSIRNDVGATNSKQPDMGPTREKFIEIILNKIVARLGSERPQILDGCNPVSNAIGKQDEYTSCNMVPLNPPRLTLDYGSATTCEGKLRAVVLNRCRNRVVAVVTTGKGGVGKTCALRGLAEYSEVTEMFGGGILYIELGNDAAISNIVEGIANIVDETGGSKLANEIKTAKSVAEVSGKASKWFGQRPCLFLVDDIWHLNGIDCDVLRSLGKMVNRKSRMVYTTRDRHFLDGAEEVIEFKEKEALGDLSREMLMTHAGFEQSTVLEPENNEALEYFLTLCDGLPLALGIVGGSVRRYAFDCAQKQDAWSEFGADVEHEEKDLMEMKAGSYGKLPKIVDSSLQVLEQRSGHEKKKIGYWFRALSVLQKQQSVPEKMLQKLWSLSSLAETKKVVESFADVSVVQMRRSCGSVCAKLHDLILDIAVRKATEASETQGFFQTLVSNYMLSESHLECESEVEKGVVAGTTEQATSNSELWHAWWNVEADGYIHDNVCRLLRNAGYVEHLLWLLSQPQWIVKRLVTDGILSVEQDLDHGIAMCNDNVSQHADRKEHLQMIGRAARLGAIFVNDNRRMEEGWFQLYGRLQWHAGWSKLTRDFVQRMERYAPKPWLKASDGVLGQAGVSELQRVLVPGRVCDIREEADAIWILSEDGDEIVHAGRYEKSTEYFKHEKLQASKGWMGISECASFLPDQGRVVIAHGRSVRVWERQTGACEQTFAHECPNHIRFVGFVAGGSRLACQLNDWSIQLWDTLSGTPVGQPLQGHTSFVECLTLSADRTRIVSGSWDETVRVWDTESGIAVRQPLQGHTDDVRCVAVSADGRRIVSGSVDKTVRVWDVESGNAVGQPLKGHTYAVSCVAISADGTRIASGSRDKTVRVWDTESGNAVGEPLQGHTDDVRCVAVSADGTRIVSGSGQKVCVWDAESGNPMRQPLLALQGHNYGVMSMTVKGDVRSSGSWNKSFVVRQIPMHIFLERPPEEQTTVVRCVAVSADGNFVVSDDPTMQRLWTLDVGGGVCVLTSGDAEWQRTIDSLELAWSSGDEKLVLQVRDFGSATVLGTCEKVVRRVSRTDLFFTADFTGWCRIVR